MAAAVSGRDWNLATFWCIWFLMLGLGQSVPQRTLSKISSMRGKYSRSFAGDAADVHVEVFVAADEEEGFGHPDGRQPWARMIGRLGKSTPMSSQKMGWAWVLAGAWGRCWCRCES